jgi:ubiquitin carboxyl-terminal hydrolase 7
MPECEPSHQGSKTIHQGVEKGTENHSYPTNFEVRRSRSSTLKEAVNPQESDLAFDLFGGANNHNRDIEEEEKEEEGEKQRRRWSPYTFFEEDMKYVMKRGHDQEEDVDMESQQMMEDPKEESTIVMADSISTTMIPSESAEEEASPETKALASKYLSDLLFHDIEAVGEFRWVVPHFSRIKETKKHSEEFTIGGRTWRLLMFPKGNNCDFLSLYLESTDPRRITDKWSCCLQFGIAILNPKDETMCVYKEAKHRFVPEEGDWGFTQFIKLSALQDETKPSEKDFLVDDTLVIQLVMRIVKDVTGNLWHTFANYDSKSETGYVGLKNQGATCYMNSILQSLYFTKYFRKTVFKMPTENDEVGKSVPLALQRIFYQLQTSEHAVSTTELTRSFGWDTLDSFMQHDVQEFNRVWRPK